MAFLHSFQLYDFLDSLVSLTAAFVLGTLIGAERQYRQRGGGLRTHVLVAVGAATFVDIGQHLNGNVGAIKYCDAAGNNCFTASSLGSSNLWESASGVIRSNSANPLPSSITMSVRTTSKVSC